MKKVWMAGIGGAVAGVVVSTQFAAPILAQEAEQEKSVYEQLDLFGDIFERIRTSYVEEVDDKDLIEAAINGMLTHLDPHSSYLPPDEFDDMRVQTKGEFGGLGIEVTQENGFVKVVSPIEGTPADRAGVQPGDFITQVDGESVMGLTLNEAVDMMRGPVGSDITLTITREGDARSVRRQAHARDDHHLAGEVAARGRRGRAAPDHLQRADLSRAREAAEGAGRGRRRHGQGDRLRASTCATTPAAC